MPAAAFTTPVITASSAAWADLRSGGLPGLLDLIIAANPALADPSVAATASVTAGASVTSLANGAYFASYTIVGRGGETLVGTSRVSGAFTIAGAPNNQPRLTLPSLPAGATCFNVYLTAAGGAAGTETLYATNVTGTTVDLVSAVFADPAKTLPTANTTGLSLIAPLIKGLMPAGPSDLMQVGPQELIHRFTSGYGMTFDHVRAEAIRMSHALATVRQAVNEAMTLIFANIGTLADGRRTFS